MAEKGQKQNPEDHATQPKEELLPFFDDRYITKDGGIVYLTPQEAGLPPRRKANSVPLPTKPQ